MLKCLLTLSRDDILLSLMCQVLCLQDQAMHVRLALLRKIHLYLQDRSLNLKYATAYALCAVDTKEIALEVNTVLFFIIANVFVVVLSLLLSPLLGFQHALAGV